MRLWLLRKLAAGEFRHEKDNPRSLYADLYLISWDSFDYIVAEVKEKERERIEKLLVALTPDQCDPKSKNYLDTEGLIAFIKGKRN